MATDSSRLVMLAAGGTGGHLFPAQALAEELNARGFVVHLMTDERVRDYGKTFPAVKTHIVSSASLGFSEPLKFPARALKLLRGYCAARRILSTYQPTAVVGFGGYPSLPPLLAATHLHLTTLVHEQNSVLGRANRLLATRVDAIATSFAEISGVPAAVEKKLLLTGNPVRENVLRYAGTPYRDFGKGAPINVLIFGGSQGARFFADAMPATFALLPEDIRRRLHITQQCRSEDMRRTKVDYKRHGIDAELSPFFPNMPELMAASHLVICRSGASTIAELAVIGRPAIMVPLPNAIDNDQLRNAESFMRAGGGFIYVQNSHSAESLAAVIGRLLLDGTTLKQAADSALRHGRPEAARNLAELVEIQMAARQPSAKETVRE